MMNGMKPIEEMDRLDALKRAYMGWLWFGIALLVGVWLTLPVGFLWLVTSGSKAVPLFLCLLGVLILCLAVLCFMKAKKIKQDIEANPSTPVTVGKKDARYQQEPTPLPGHGTPPNWMGMGLGSGSSGSGPY